MRRLALLAFTALCAGCNANVSFDPEGLLCDPGGVCPDGYVCAAGVCRNQVTCPNGACACDAIVCQAAPPAQCLDNSTLRTFAEGVCNPADATCDYAPADTACPLGCADGACVNDACLGIACVNVPAAVCADATTVKVYSGLCVEGACSYPSISTTCINGCSAGRCQNQNLCTGITCNNPPANGCVAGKLRTYTSAGTCDSGTGACSYSFTEASCPGGCIAAACIGSSLVFTQTGPKIRHATNAVDQVPNSFGGHLLAVGPGGAATRWNGTAWKALPTGTVQDLNSVYLATSTAGWVVGDDKTVLRYDGSALNATTLPGGPSGAKLVAVHGRNDNHVVAVDDQGNFWRYNGSSWSAGALPSASGPFATTGVYVDASGHERISGSCGSPSKGCLSYAASITATPWVDLDTDAEGFRSVGPSVDTASANYAYGGHAVSATVRRHKTFSSPYFDSTSVPTSLGGTGVVGISPAATALGQAVYLLTARGSAAGHLYRFTSAGTLDPASALLDLWGSVQAMSRTDSGGVLVADSQDASTSLYRRGVVTNQVLDLGEDWQGAAFGAAGSLLLMNSDGDLASRPLGGAWSFKRSPTSRIYGFAAGTAMSIIAGSDGEAYRVGASYSPLSTATTTTFRSVCRVSDVEWYLVGDGGVIRGSDGVSVSNVASPTTTNLLGVACLGIKSAVAVGAGGTVLRLSGTTWQTASPSFPDGTATLTSVALGPQAVLYVAGDGVFAKLEGGAWTALPAKPGLNHLQVLGPNDIYAVANGNQVVRFDGTSWSTRFTSSDPLFAGASMTGKVVFAGRNGALVEGQ